MKTIAFNLQKGGTGKTTLATQIAENLAASGRTVLIDLDPQGNATDHYTAADYEHELADYFIDSATTVHDLILKNPDFDFDIIPTAKSGNLADIKHRITAEMIANLLTELAGIGYKYCILDTPPEMGVYIGAILQNVNEVVTPMKPEKFALNGIRIFQEIADKAREKNPALNYDKIILNNYNRAKAKDMYYFENLPAVFNTFKIYNIPTSTKWEYAQSSQKPLYKPQGKPPRGLETTINELARLTADLK